MSAFNSFKVLTIENNHVDVEVTIVHPDEHTMNTSVNFALQILLELYEKIKLGYIYNDNWQHFPFTQEEGNKLIKPEHVEILDDLLLKMRWREIPVTEEEYNQINISGVYEYKGQKLSSTGMSNGQYYVSLETEYDEFCEAAYKHIEVIEQLSISNYPHWFDRMDTWLEHGKLGYDFTQEEFDAHENEPNPSYVIRIHVNPESNFLLEHIVPGCSWDSAAFNFLPYCTYYHSFKYPILHTLSYIPKINPAPDNDLSNWWNNLSEDWRVAFLINLDFQRRMIYPQMKRNYCGMMLNTTYERLEGSEKLEAFKSYQPTIEELRLISQLSIMVISGMNFEDLEPLRMLKGLRILDSESNPLKNLDGIKDLTELEYLTIVTFSKPKPDHLVLSNLTKLRELVIDPTKQEELDMIGEFSYLRKVSLACKFEADLSVFAKLKNLKTIIGSDREPASDAKRALIEQLRNNDVEINWDYAPKNGEFGSY